MTNKNVIKQYFANRKFKMHLEQKLKSILQCRNVVARKMTYKLKTKTKPSIISILMVYISNELSFVVKVNEQHNGFDGEEDT